MPEQKSVNRLKLELAVERRRNTNLTNWVANLIEEIKEGKKKYRNTLQKFKDLQCKLEGPISYRQKIIDRLEKDAQEDARTINRLCDKVEAFKNSHAEMNRFLDKVAKTFLIPRQEKEGETK